MDAAVASYVPDLAPLGRYHWSIAQAEYATKIVFRGASDLTSLYDHLLRTAIHAQKAEPEHFVDEVEVVNAPAAVGPQVGHAASLVVPRPVRRTELHHRKDLHQPGCVPRLATISRMRMPG